MILLASFGLAMVAGTLVFVWYMENHGIEARSRRFCEKVFAKEEEDM